MASAVDGPPYVSWHFWQAGQEMLLAVWVQLCIATGGVGAAVYRKTALRCAYLLRVVAGMALDVLDVPLRLPPVYHVLHGRVGHGALGQDEERRG